MLSLKTLAALAARIRPPFIGELCLVWQMVIFGCSGQYWATANVEPALGKVANDWGMGRKSSPRPPPKGARTIKWAAVALAQRAGYLSPLGLLPSRKAETSQAMSGEAFISGRSRHAAQSLSRRNLRLTVEFPSTSSRDKSRC